MTFAIDTHFPAANIAIEHIADDTITLRPDLRDTEGWWFWWEFKVWGAEGRRLTFEFVKGDPIGLLGPAVSFDGGSCWRWLGAAAVARQAGDTHDQRGARFALDVPEGCAEVLVAHAPPYTRARLDAFLDSLDAPARSQIVCETLCRSRGGRDVPLLRLGRLDGRAPWALAMVARHHACECMASYVLEGMLAAAVSDGPTGRWFRENAAIVCVPFVDADGVEQGDQGKNRRPHDHNRDYIDTPLYPETAAIKARMSEWIGWRRAMALDMHCPALRDDATYFVGTPDDALWAQTRRLSAYLVETSVGSLAHTAAADLPHGQKWNTLAEARSFCRWAAPLDGIVIANTLETPYALANGREVTPESARAFGVDLAEAIRRYASG